ncbi:MAG: hypothetical protein JWM16_2428 [Verrucomicrobiales bacterium]|nr:hypothetical protein [Verrucomicrobiales bacterium]
MNDMLIGGIEKREIVVVDYDPLWPEKFQKHARLIAQALGLKALCVDHVGSTSVPGLAAKPIIDVVVVVENSGDEAAYLPALLAAGYILRVREPDWYQHRMLRTPQLDVHVHIILKSHLPMMLLLWGHVLLYLLKLGHTGMEQFRPFCSRKNV